MGSKTFTDRGAQTLTPIPIPDTEEGRRAYSFDCFLCEKYWIPRATEALMYKAYRKVSDAIEEVRICFECASERLQRAILSETQSDSYLNKDSWFSFHVMILKFNCCKCGLSVDRNYKITDGYAGKIPFVGYVFRTRHKFCVLCWELVKDGSEDENGKVLLDPSRCNRNHQNDVEDYQNVRLYENDFLI